MTLKIKTIGVDGGGKFATALAQSFSLREDIEKVVMYVRDEKRARYINKKRKNIKYFPSFELDKKISATSDLSKIGGTDLVVLVVPTEDVESALTALKPFYNKQPILNTNKGLEKKGRLIHEVINDVMGEIPLLHMTGAALADEIIYGYPCCNELASFDFSLAKDISDQLTTKSFILKPTDDLIGAELVGSFKNIMMLILGMADTLYNHSQNVRGALIGEGLRELNILREGLRAKNNNSLEISLGDFYLTKSRNYQFGRDFAAERIFTGKFNPLTQFINLQARLKRRKYRNYIQEVRATYEEIIKLFASGMHELINGAEKVLTAKMSGAYSHNPTSETLEGYRSIVPFCLIGKKLGVMNELLVVDGLYKIFHGGKSEKEVINQILVKIGEAK